LYNFSHVPMLEFIWTLFPGIILIFMAYPSFKLLYAIDAVVDPIVTVVIYGNQWYWTYEYSDFNIISSLLAQLDNLNILKIFKEVRVDKKIFAYCYALDDINYSDMALNNYELLDEVAYGDTYSNFLYFFNFKKLITLASFDAFVINF